MDENVIFVVVVTGSVLIVGSIIADLLLRFVPLKRADEKMAKIAKKYRYNGF